MADETVGAGDRDDDLAAATESAWVGFRARLADFAAEMEDADVLLVEAETAADEEDPAQLEGGTPHLGVSRTDDGRLQVQVPGNGVLDRRFRHDTDAFLVLDLAGWELDEDDHFSRHFEAREVDHLAVACVEVLREVYGVPHPAFLRADGLERDPRGAAPTADGVVSDRSEWEPTGDAGVLPGSHDELTALVDEALAEMAGDLEHDGDGDVPVRAGLSVVFVRVLPDRPAVELFAEVVSDPQHPERLPVELDILNRSHDLAKFYLAGTTVRMSYVLVAWPFSARQLRTTLRRLLEEVDDLAEALAARVGGRRFLEEPEPEEALEVVDPRVDAAPLQPPSHPGMVGLVELLHLGPVSSPAVGALFEHDRQAILRHLVGIRTGRVDCGGHDQERVLGCLRRGLRYVVDGEIPERRRRHLPARLSTEQAMLISDDELGEDTLDLGWSA